MYICGGFSVRMFVVIAGMFISSFSFVVIIAIMTCHGWRRIVNDPQPKPSGGAVPHWSNSMCHGPRWDIQRVPHQNLNCFLKPKFAMVHHKHPHSTGLHFVQSDNCWELGVEPAPLQGGLLAAEGKAIAVAPNWQDMAKNSAVEQLKTKHKNTQPVFLWTLW